MLDQAIHDQLKTVFSKLEGTVDFVYEPSEHTSQAELVEFLTDIAATSEKMSARESGVKRATPHFTIYHNGAPTRISFLGIPSGHEFTSLIIAILQADGKGKWPDDSILARIKRLKGPIQLKTFMSLTCENCPDVVQALNMMSLVHPDFSNETIDGGYVQDEIDALKIQGVPSVVAGDLLIHSGRISLIDLLAKLEEHFGLQDGAVLTHADLGDFDVAVIGGGPAGASAAIYSVRKRFEDDSDRRKNGWPSSGNERH